MLEATVTAACWSAHSVTSHSTATARSRPPSSSASSSSLSIERAARTRRQPSAASARADAAPMPDDAPVRRKTRSSPLMRPTLAPRPARREDDGSWKHQLRVRPKPHLLSAVTPETLAAIAQAFNDHDTDAVLSFFADDAVFETPKGPDPVGAAARRDRPGPGGSRSALRRDPRCPLRRREHWVSGDRGVSEWTLTGTTVDGERIAVRGCDLWTFRDGKVVRKDSYWKLVE